MTLYVEPVLLICTAAPVYSTADKESISTIVSVCTHLWKVPRYNAPKGLGNQAFLQAPDTSRQKSAFITEQHASSAQAVNPGHDALCCKQLSAEAATTWIASWPSAMCQSALPDCCRHMLLLLLMWRLAVCQAGANMAPSCSCAAGRGPGACQGRRQ